MKLNDKYLRENLKHLYWLNGGPCAGKTTMTKKFVEELGFRTLEDDILKYRGFSCPKEHAALQYPHPGLNWYEWFNRPTEVHTTWLLDAAVEMMEYFIVDLLKMSDDRPIVVDLGILPDAILPIIPKERMICLVTSAEEIERLYFFREDHKMILDCINKYTENPQQSIEHSNKAMVRYSEEIKESCLKRGIKTIERTPELTVDEQFKLVCEHFGFIENHKSQLSD